MMMGWGIRRHWRRMIVRVRLVLIGGIGIRRGGRGGRRRRCRRRMRVLLRRRRGGMLVVGVGVGGGGPSISLLGTSEMGGCGCA